MNDLISILKGAARMLDNAEALLFLRGKYKLELTELETDAIETAVYLTVNGAKEHIDVLTATLEKRASDAGAN